MSNEQKDQAEAMTDAAMQKATAEKLWVQGEALTGVLNQLLVQLSAAKIVRVNVGAKTRSLALEVLFNEAMNGITVAEFARLVDEARETPQGKKLLAAVAREKAKGVCGCSDPECPDAPKKPQG